MTHNRGMNRCFFDTNGKAKMPYRELSCGFKSSTSSSTPTPTSTSSTRSSSRSMSSSTNTCLRNAAIGCALQPYSGSIATDRRQIGSCLDSANKNCFK